MATVITDKLDYAPGETAIITADGFYPGSTIKFQVQHITAGLDGVFGTSDDGLVIIPDQDMIPGVSRITTGILIRIISAVLCKPYGL